MPISTHAHTIPLAQAWQRNGAKVIVGIQSDRFRRTAEGLFANWGESPRVVECDVSNDDSLRGAFEQVSDLGDGRLDALAHCIAFAPATAMRRLVVSIWPDLFTADEFDALFAARCFTLAVTTFQWQWTLVRIHWSP